LPFLLASGTSASWHILEYRFKRKCIFIYLLGANNTVNLLWISGNSCSPQAWPCGLDWDDAGRLDVTRETGESICLHRDRVLGPGVCEQGLVEVDRVNSAVVARRCERHQSE
jgi:hypothetical protein